jgi:hypothetical protein
MHSDWFHGVEIVQGRWQRGEDVGYWYPNRLERAICKWDIYVPLVTKGLTIATAAGGNIQIP